MNAANLCRHCGACRTWHEVEEDIWILYCPSCERTEIFDLGQVFEVMEDRRLEELESE